MNCPICILAYMGQHPELIFWKKCPTCGFCKLDEEAVKRRPTLPLMIKYDGTVAQPSKKD